MNEKPKPAPGKSRPDAEHRYFVYDPENYGPEFFKSAEDRDHAAGELVAAYLDDGFWSDEVERVHVGVVTGVATKVNVIQRPDDLDDEGCDGEGRWWDADWSSICDYRMLPPGTKEDSFYLQDSRNYIGNDMVWWAKDRNGYTTDLSRAHVFTREEAQRQHDSRPTDIPWPCAYIAARTRPAVDMQHAKRDEAIAGSGITLKPDPTTCEQKPVYHCVGCGRIQSEAQHWAGACKHCGTDSRP